MNSRYIRQTTLSEFGAERQEALKKSKVLVVGAGGLGVPVLTYLNAMGVGTLGIADADVVATSNLHRQVLYKENTVGVLKVTAAKIQLQEQNSETTIVTYPIIVNNTNALKIIQQYDLVVDATDNFPARYLINDACVILNKPFIYGALHGFEGQVSVFNYQSGPTYRCLFPTMPTSEELPNCNDHGVLGILPGIVGSLQALEAIKVLTGVGEPLSGTLLLYDALSQTIQKMKFYRDAQQPTVVKLADSYEVSCEVKQLTISAGELYALWDTGGVQIIDVRSEVEYQDNHLKGATNIPLADLENQIKVIKATNPIYVICQSGIRSKKAVIALEKILPQSKIIQVTGGMNAIDTHVATS